jgi:hypothetical protein
VADLATWLHGLVGDAGHYVFRTEWRIDAAPDAVYAALADVAGYPAWWHEVRETVELGPESGRIRCRSLLPYDLTMVLTRELVDADARVLRARLEGDLNGTSQWHVTPNGHGSVAVFDEDVRVGKAMVRAAGRLARPVLTFNHDRMMRSGERGLRRHLA